MKIELTKRLIILLVTLVLLIVVVEIYKPETKDYLIKQANSVIDSVTGKFPKKSIVPKQPNLNTSHDLEQIRQIKEASTPPKH